jgi:beta-fructofuranosidase
MKVAGWSGMMSLPRVLSLDKDGTLRIKSLPEAAVLRAGVLPYQETRAGLLKIIPKATGEVLCTGARSRRMSFTMSDGSKELLSAVYLPEKNSFVVDGSEMTLKPADVPSLHAYVDGSVIELIVSERIGYTKRFYYAGSIAPDILVSATGTGDLKMTGWKIAAISKNRLTTPAFTL